MPLKVKVIHIYIYYLMYKHLCNMTLNVDVAFLLSSSIYYCCLLKADNFLIIPRIKVRYGIYAIIGKCILYISAKIQRRYGVT